MANAGGRPMASLVLEADERAYPERQVRRRRIARSMSERCRIILRCADGMQSKVVATELGVHEHTVGKWRRRFLKGRVEGLLDEAQLGRPRTIGDDQVARRDRAHAALDASQCDALVNPLDGRRDRLLPHHDPAYLDGLRAAAHRSETFKLSSDPLFVNKVRDIVGLAEVCRGHESD